MKFQIFGTDFKTLVDRISGVVSKKSSINAFECVKIVAYNNTIEFQTENGYSFASIVYPALVIEDGETWVHLSDLKKVSNIKDNLMITAGNDLFEVRNSKKSYEVICHNDYDDYWNYDISSNMEFLCKVEDNIFIKHLSSLNCMRAVNDPREIMTGFCMDISNHKLVTLDGYRICIANIDGEFNQNVNKKLIINGNISSELKSLVGKINIPNYINILYDDRRIKIIGEDYTYITELIDGVYYDYQGLINNEFDYSYTFNKNEMKEIAKEYSKVVSSKEKIPMIFYNNAGNIATGIQTATYKTSDKLEHIDPNYGMDRNWFVGINPRYIVDACNIFESDIEQKGKYSNKTPIHFNDDVYEIVILPININEKDISFVEKQVA